MTFWTWFFLVILPLLIILLAVLVSFSIQEE